MSKKHHSYKKKVALPPGSLVHVGKPGGADMHLSVVCFSPAQYEATDIKALSELNSLMSESAVTWLQIEGLQDTEILELLGQAYGIHPLTLEDILNTNHRPKTDFYETYIYSVLKLIQYNSTNKRLETTQVSLILFPQFVISIHEHRDGIFDPLRSRLSKATGKMRHEGADFLFYSMMDLIIDHYFICLEEMDDQIEYLESRVLQDPTAQLVSSLQQIKWELLSLRKTIWPLREQITVLLREEHSALGSDMSIYVRDLYDHTLAIMDTVEILRDMTLGLLDVYLSSMSNRMNEIMKVLTIIATIFIPLTFITGIYGMNFLHMPELGMKWAYPIVLGTCTTIAGLMLLFFRKRRWL